MGEEVGSEQPVEVDEDHGVQESDGKEEVVAVVQPGVVVQDVPGDVELGAEAEGDVGEEVEELVGAVELRGLSSSQL